MLSTTVIAWPPGFTVSWPFSATRLVEADSVPAAAGDGADAELPAELARLVPAWIGAPGDRRATGVVVTPPGESGGTSPGPAPQDGTAVRVERHGIPVVGFGEPGGIASHDGGDNLRVLHAALP